MTTDIQPYTPQEAALVQQMGLAEVPVAHVKTFLHIAKAMHLDPKLKRDITLITRRSKNGPTYTVQVGIAGYRKSGRLIAKAEGETLKVDPWLFKGADGDWTEVWDAKGGKNPPLAAKATIYRDGMPFTQVVMWAEFVQQNNGRPQALWASKPTYMLGKTAESLAWRQAFPEEMGSTYEEAEVEAIQADATRADDNRGVDKVRAALAARKPSPEPQEPEEAPQVTQAALLDRAATAGPDDLEGLNNLAQASLPPEEFQVVHQALSDRYYALQEKEA